MAVEIPSELRERVPLIKSGCMELLRKMREHPHAPLWNTRCGDRLTSDDIQFVRKFGESLESLRNEKNLLPDIAAIEWIERMRGRSLWFSEALGEIDIRNNFTQVPCMCRADLQDSLEQIVPDDADLDRLIINPTSGSTGQPILCPNHPRGVGCYDPLIQFILKRHGIAENYDHTKVAAIQFCAQRETITYNTVHSYLNGAGFAKINIFPGQWKSPESPKIFVRDMAPVFYSGDPFAYAYAMRTGIDYRPRGIISTALTLEEGLRKELADYYRCPVINFYSLNETGPVAYSCPENPDRLHILPHDIHVETLYDDGTPAEEGMPGEITITGGRNPYMPLLRYRTGDYAILDYSPCACGDPMPSLMNLSARKQMIFFTKENLPVNPIDISRILRQYPIVLFRFLQKADHSCVLDLCPVYSLSAETEEEIGAALSEIFDNTVSIEMFSDLEPEDGKVIPFVCEIE